MKKTIVGLIFTTFSHYLKITCKELSIMVIQRKKSLSLARFNHSIQINDHIKTKDMIL